MRHQVPAGHMPVVELFTFGEGYAVAAGYLKEDLRGTDHHGEYRDFSGSKVRTSWLEALEYDAESDTTNIVTRNSIYTTEGNIIKSELNLDVDSIEGRVELYEAVKNAKD